MSSFTRWPVQEGSLLFRNRKTGGTRRLEIANLTLERQSGALPLGVAMKAAYDRKDVFLRGRYRFAERFARPRERLVFRTGPEGRPNRCVGRRPAARSTGGKAAPYRSPHNGSPSGWYAPGWPVHRKRTAPPKDASRVLSDVTVAFRRTARLGSKDRVGHPGIADAPYRFKAGQGAYFRSRRAAWRWGRPGATAGGGDYQAHLQVDAPDQTPATIKTSLKIDQMNAELMLKELGLRDTLGGRAGYPGRT